MLDVSNEEPAPEPDISPSSPYETIYMSIDSNDSTDDDNDDSVDPDDVENTGLGDEEGNTNRPSEAVFHHPPNPAAVTVDLDTESETSDEESEHQSVSPLDPEGSGCSGLSNAQTGRCFHSVVGYPTSTEPWETCHR